MQRLATSYVKRFIRLPYSERLHEPKLPSMERHFLRATLITVYKLFHSYLNLSAEEFFELPAAGNLRGHKFKVHQPRFHLARYIFQCDLRISLIMVSDCFSPNYEPVRLVEFANWKDSAVKICNIHCHSIIGGKLKSMKGLPFRKES